MTEKTAATFNVDIHMAGDFALAAATIQRYASETGICVTIAPESFVYTGGREEGFRIGFINYPRFPKEPGEILARARDLASVLLVQLGQQSYSIVTPTETIWISHRPEDATPSPQTTESEAPRRDVWAEIDADIARKGGIGNALDDPAFCDAVMAVIREAQKRRRL